jgi:fatty-acid desaturase
MRSYKNSIKLFFAPVCPALAGFFTWLLKSAGVKNAGFQEFSFEKRGNNLWWLNRGIGILG